MKTRRGTGCRFRTAQFDYEGQSNLSEEDAMKFLCLICAEN